MQARDRRQTAERPTGAPRRAAGQPSSPGARPAVPARLTFGEALAEYGLARAARLLGAPKLRMPH